jgi:hypothetical protein
MFSKEQGLELTRGWKGERFPEGRPKVPDELLADMLFGSAAFSKLEAAVEPCGRES